MPRQMNQLQKFYNSITNDGVKIRTTSLYDGHIYYQVEGSHVKAFFIGYYNDRLYPASEGSSIIRLGSSSWTNRDGSYYKQNVDLCSFKRGSAGYSLLSDLFNSLTKLDFNTDYDGKKFCNDTFLPFIKALLSLKDRIESTPTELPDLKQVIEEIKRSNFSNGITIQNIENVKNTTNILGDPIFNDTNVKRPKLLKISGSDKENIGTVTAGASIVAVAMLMTIAVVAIFSYLSWSKKSKGRIRPEEETPSSSLINIITLESRDNCID